MTDDGGSVHSDLMLQAERALIQRTFVYELLSSGIAVALMRGSEFKDAKVAPVCLIFLSMLTRVQIFSFIYEQRRVFNAKARLDPSIWSAREDAVKILEMNLTPSVIETSSLTRTEWLSNASSAFLNSVEADDTLAYPCLFVFLAHGLILDTIHVSLRAQPLPSLSPEIEGYLREKFFHILFECLQRSLPSRPTFHDTDLDVRVFLHLLRAVPPGFATSDALTNLIGATHASELVQLWKGLGNDTVFSFPVISGDSMVPKRESDHDVLSVLPFSHPILDEHLVKVQVDTVSSSLDPDPGKFDLSSGFGTVFKDVMHWHNGKKPLLPKHLGGEDDKSVPNTIKSLARARRRDQRFHASLQKHAQTLTGAFGKEIETILIPPGKGKANEATSSKKVNKKFQGCGAFTYLFVVFTSAHDQYYTRHKTKTDEDDIN